VRTPWSISSATIPISAAAFGWRHRDGWSRRLDAGYFAPGVSTVAVAIVDTFGEVRYGLSGIMFSGQYDYKMTDKIGRQMIELSMWAAGRLISQPVNLKRA
jgi:DNA-binding IclR family transcriptional regulator